MNRYRISIGYREFDLNNSDLSIFCKWLLTDRDKDVYYILYVLDKPWHREVQVLYNEFQDRDIN